MTPPSPPPSGHKGPSVGGAGGNPWVLAGLLLALGCFQWLTRWHGLGHFADPTVYLAGAKSLAAGDGYRLCLHLGTPSIGFYPPLQSLVLAPVWRWNPAFPANLDGFYLVQLVLGLGTLALGGLYLRRAGVPGWLNLLTIAAWGLSPMWQAWLWFLCSDIGCSGVAVALLLLWQRRADTSPPSSPPRFAGDEASAGRWVLTGLLLAVAYLWRSAALAWIAATGLILLWRLKREGWRRWYGPLLFFGVPTSLAVLGWSWLARGGVGYGPILQRYAQWHREHDGLGTLYLGNLVDALRGIPFWQMLASGTVMSSRYLGARVHPALPWLGFTILAGLFWTAVWMAGRGWNRRDGRDQALLIVLVVYALEIVVMPFPGESFHRYLFPLLPLFVVWLWRGAANLPGNCPRALRHFPAFLLTFAVLSNVTLGRSATRYLREFFPVNELRETTEWLRRETPPAARIGADYYLPLVHLHEWLDRPLLVDPFSYGQLSAPITHAQQGLTPPDFVVVSPNSYSAYTPPDGLDRVFRSSHGAFEVWRVEAAKTRAYFDGTMRCAPPVAKP